MIGRLNHVAIAVPDLAAASRLYAEALGAEVSAPLPQPDHGVSVSVDAAAAAIRPAASTISATRSRISGQRATG